MNGIEAQKAALAEAVESLALEIERLDEGTFLGPLGRWSARDVVAHLIGWNRYTVRGMAQIVRGELPFYDVDPGDDYANVNRAHVRDYPSRLRAELLSELRASARELSEALSALDLETWSRDYGVRHKGQTVTVESTVNDLIVDYAHHGEQIRALAQ
ncbi:MAG TPA: maleylpyruvate isomerase N-terminal domain-containing protein [Vicinamibacteria bacterium]|nr:maleylpyruvate isomerase N-terminal domain-containing protein [Vicinamibacteria bacterium]